jgi:hypothetical protein
LRFSRPSHESTALHAEAIDKVSTAIDVVIRHPEPVIVAAIRTQHLVLLGDDQAVKFVVRMGREVLRAVIRAIRPGLTIETQGVAGYDREISDTVESIGEAAALHSVTDADEIRLIQEAIAVADLPIVEPDLALNCHG